MPVWSISYSDGSANAYRFAPDGDGATFEYIPVTPEQSSTGMYSGGDPRSGRLDAKVVARLWEQIRALESNVALHVEDRGKGTGLFHVTETAGTRSFIILRGPALATFDEFVAKLS